MGDLLGLLSSDCTYLDLHYMWGHGRGNIVKERDIVAGETHRSRLIEMDIRIYLIILGV